MFRNLTEVETAAVAGARTLDIPVFPCPIAPEPKTVPLIGPTVCPPPPSFDDLLF